MLELYLGGARSGKSRLAEKAALAIGKQLHYIATATADDEEMQARINKHKDTRANHSWVTIEEPIALAKALREYDAPSHCVLVDCLTLWLSNCLLAEDSHCWSNQRTQFFDSLTALSCDVIFVSNEVGQGIVPMGEINRQFVDESGFLHQELAGYCDRVIFTVAGLPQVLKGDATL